jgi:beta-lactamase regulating signal transducer with metallopeptidase domain
MMLGSDSSLFLLELVWQQLWIGIVLVLLVNGCLRAARRLNAATRHWIWALTLLTLTLLPLASLLPEAAVTQDVEYEFSQHATAAPSGAVRAAEESIAGAGAEATQPRSRALVAGFGGQIRSSQGVRWLASSLLALWCAGTLCMFLGLVRGARTATKLRRESAPAPIRSNLADIRLTAEVDSPMVVGLRHPCILIPSALFDEIPRPELQRILHHELAHVRRGDHWMMLLQRFVEAVWFFHPAVRFAARRLDLEREISCDDRAALDRRNSYADSLVRICRTMLTVRTSAPLAVGSVQSQSQLAQRVSCLLDSHRNHAPDVSRTGIAMSSFLLVGALAVAMEWMPRLAVAEGLPAEFGSPLREAAAAGDLDMLRGLIDASAMMQAAARDDVALLEQLAAAGADLNHWTPGDGTPLIAAARRGKLAAAQWLLDNGADVNLAARGDGNPLILAAANGHLDLVRLLLDRGANIDAVVPGDETALITSARVGAVESVRLLLERGADVELAVPAGGMFGRTEVRTALNQARSGGHEDIAALLVSHGARR